jgi:hypothetical protein
MDKIKYKTIPPDVLIDIKISGAFYRRMVDLLTLLGESIPLEEFKALLVKLKDNKPVESSLEFSVQTLLTLIFEVEKEAVSQNKTKEEEVEIPAEAPATGS